jgi:hypothetical protein
VTICVAACVHDGIAFGADSATSLVSTAGGRSVVTNVYRHGNKVFNLYKKLSICAMTAGMGSIGTAPIHALAKDFRRSLKDSDSPYYIDRQAYTIEDVAIKARAFLFEEKYAALPDPLPAPHSLEFWVGGCSSATHSHELWKIAIVNGNCDPPERLCGEGETGLFVGGQPSPIYRLLRGFDESIEEPLLRAGVPPADLPQLLQVMAQHTEVQLLHPAMPIQDAIELVDFLVGMTKSYYRFLPGADTVGGETDIAVVTRHEQFKWVKRKHYYPSALNLMETDHV